MTAVRNDWQETRLGEIADFRNGVNYTKENFGRGVKVINVKDFQDYSTPKYDTLDEINPDGAVRAAHLLQENDVIFVRSNGNRELIGRSLALLAVPPEPITHSAFTIRVRLHRRPELNPRFYAYVFRSHVIRQVLSAQGNGANISNLNQDILERLVVPVPTRPQQDRIAAILSAYDDLIENNTRRIAILEEMARRLYEEWFVHFRFPGHEEAEFDGELPKGWITSQLQDVAHLVMGQSPKSEFYNRDGEGLAFHQGVSDFGPFFPTDRLFCTADGRMAEDGDVLLSVRAPVGRINIATKKIVIGRGLCAIRSIDGAQALLLSQLRDRFAEEDSMGSGAIFNAVTKKDLQTLDLVCPPTAVVNNFELHAKPFWSTIRTLSDKNANLRAQRDMLLPKLISGEIDVSGAEGLLEAAE